MSGRRSSDVETLPLPENDTSAPTTAASFSAALGTGARVGRYVIEGVLGEGGMGVVYDAYDPELQRSVALKVLPIRVRGSVSAQRRLMREAQAMARVNHPNVVAVHDVGLCPAGIYVAMDRIDGRTVARWVLQDTPHWRTVVEVFGEVAEGLMAIHRAGMTHRDIKPSNVMVADLDGDRPRRVVVMDLGLAHDPTGRTARSGSDASASSSASLTRTGATVGTPAYMAPEQFMGGAADALSDQFSLCVALYECLFHLRPYPGRTMEALMLSVSAGLLAPLPATAPEVPAAVRRVVVRGLRPHRSDRWPSLEALAVALARAASPSRVPRRLALGAGVMGVLAWGLSTPRPAPSCVEATVAVGERWSDARAEELERALGRDASAPRTLAALASWRAKWSEALQRACDGSPSQDAATETTALDHDRRLHCLERQWMTFDAMTHSWSASDIDPKQIASGAEKLGDPDACLRDPQRALDDVPAEVRRGLERRLADAVAAMRAGHYPRARKLAADLLDLARAEGAAHVAEEARFELGYVQFLSGQLEESAHTLEGAYWGALDADDPMLAARSASALAYLNTEELARYQVADTWLRHAEAQLDRADGRRSDTMGEVWTHAALLAQKQQRYAEAETLFRRAIDLYAERYGPDDVHGAPAHHNLGALYARVRRFEEAKRAYARAIALREATYGPEHPDVASSINGLANVLRDEGEFDAAREHYERALRIRESTLGPTHPRTMAVVTGLGTIASMQGDHEAAIAAMQRAVEMALAHYGPDHPTTAGALDNLGLALAGAGRFDEAAEQHRDALERLQRRLGPDHLAVAGSARSLATAHLQAGRAEEAVDPLRRAIEIRRTATPDDRRFLVEDLLLLSYALVEVGRGAEGVAPATEALALRELAPPALRAEAEYTLAQALRGAGDEDEARRRAQAALQALGPSGEDTLRGEIEAFVGL